LSRLGCFRLRRSQQPSADKADGYRTAEHSPGMMPDVLAHVEGVFDRIGHGFHSLLDVLRNRIHDRLDILDGVRHDRCRFLNSAEHMVFQGVQLLREGSSLFFHLVVNYFEFAIHWTFSFTVATVCSGRGLKDSNFFLPASNRAVPDPRNTSVTIP